MDTESWNGLSYKISLRSSSPVINPTVPNPRHEAGWRRVRGSLGVVQGGSHWHQEQAGALPAPHCQQHCMSDLGQAQWELQ